MVQDVGDRAQARHHSQHLHRTEIAAIGRWVSQPFTPNGGPTAQAMERGGQSHSFELGRWQIQQLPDRLRQRRHFRRRSGILPIGQLQQFR